MLSLKQELSNDLLIQEITEYIARHVRPAPHDLPQPSIFYRIAREPAYPTRLDIQATVNGWRPPDQPELYPTVAIVINGGTSLSIERVDENPFGNEGTWELVKGFINDLRNAITLKYGKADDKEPEHRMSGHWTYTPEEREKIVHEYRAAEQRGEVVNRNAWARSHTNVSGRTLSEYLKEFPEDAS